jgi:hypothetical protein
MIFKYNCNHKPIKYCLRHVKKDYMDFFKYKSLHPIFSDYRFIFDNPNMAFKYAVINSDCFKRTKHSLRISSYSLI